MKSKDVSELIERLEAFEERAGVRLEALSARMNADFGDEDQVHVKVLGEIHAAGGDRLRGDVKLQLAVYDNRGRVIARAEEAIYADEFFAFEAFELEALYIPKQQLSRLRIIAKSGG